MSRNWSAAVSWADGTSWSDAEATQRVYEYTVEPTTIQHLPDHALLLVMPTIGGPSLAPVECDPAIITLPRVSVASFRRSGPGGRTESSRHLAPGTWHPAAGASDEAAPAITGGAPRPQWPRAGWQPSQDEPDPVRFSWPPRQPGSR